MFDAWLRAFKDRLLAPWLRHVGRTVHPALVSVAGFAVGLGAAFAAWHREYAIALLLWLASRVLDGVDGALARVQGTVSDFGGYLDIVFDFVVYALIPLALVAGSPAPGAVPEVAALLGVFYVNAAAWMYLAAILERRRHDATTRGRTTIVMPPGLVGGAETIVLYSAFLIFPGHLRLLFAITGALVAVTVVQRLVWAARHL